MARAKRRRLDERRPEPAPPVERPDWILAALAAAGMLVSGYLTWLKLTGGSARFCVSGSGCDVIQASRYATFLWMPTALWGLAVYVSLAALAVKGLTARTWLIAFVLAAGGVGFSLYLTWLSIFEIGTTCAWCLVSAALLTAALAVIVMRRPVRGRRTVLASGRLIGYGVLSSVGAIVAGAFVFAAPFSAPAGYQEALARHLTESKAIMYGAFW